MNPLFHLGMRLGPRGRRWVAAAGWVFVAAPCLAAGAIAGFFAMADGSAALRGTHWVSAPGTVESVGRQESVDGNTTRVSGAVAYRYAYGGATYHGLSPFTEYHYQNEGARQYEEERTAWLPEEGHRLRVGDAVTVHVDPSSPARSVLGEPLGRAGLGLLLLYGVSATAAGVLLSVLAWLYLREPVEIVVASPPRADAVVAVGLGALRRDGQASEEVEISRDVARIRRAEGTTFIEVAGGPAFRPSGLFPPALLLVIVVGGIALKGLSPATRGGALAYAAAVTVAGFMLWAMAYGRARSEIRIRGGVMEVATPALAGLRRRRVTRGEVDRLESRWALSELSRFGEAAYFDVVAVLGDGRRVRVAEALPRVEVADSLVRLVARELGLAPEQAVGAAQARHFDEEAVRAALAPGAPPTNP